MLEGISIDINGTTVRRSGNSLREDGRYSINISKRLGELLTKFSSATFSTAREMRAALDVELDLMKECLHNDAHAGSKCIALILDSPCK